MKVFIKAITVLLVLLLTCSFANAAALFNYPKFKAVTSTGAALTGGLVYTYNSGSTTPKATYSDRAMTTPNTNPVVLDSRGEATIYFNGTYKVVLKSSTGVTQWTMDKVAGITPTGESYEVQAIDYGSSTCTGATISAALTAIGVSTKTTLILTSCTWVISANTDWSTYTNVALKFAPGAVISNGAYTVKWGGSVEALPDQQIADGTGSWTLNPAKVTTAYINWFGANTTPGTTDMTAAIKSALLSLRDVTFLRQNYLVTDTLLIVPYQHVRGQNKTMVPSWRTVSLDETAITFAPTSEKDLFDIVNTGGGSPTVPGYKYNIHISGIRVVGNTTGAVTNSRYGIYCAAAESTFENLSFMYFQVGIYTRYTLTNHYSNINLAEMSTACIETDADTTYYSTTDIFTNVVCQLSPWGAILRKGYDFKFQNCLWEHLTTGGVNIYKDFIGAEFTDGYAEEVPSTVAGDSYAMFYINKDGTTASNRGTIKISGGYYMGGATNWGSFVDVGVANGGQNVVVTGANYSRYKYRIKRDSTLTLFMGVVERDTGWANVTNAADTNVGTVMLNNGTYTDNYPLMYPLLTLQIFGNTINEMGILSVIQNADTIRPKLITTSSTPLIEIGATAGKLGISISATSDLIGGRGFFTGSATGWTLGAGWAYGTNNIVKTAGTGTAGDTTWAATVGYIYELTFTVSGWSTGANRTLTPSVGGVNGTAISADGTYVQYITATTTGGLLFTPTGTDATNVGLTLDGVYIKRSLQGITYTNRTGETITLMRSLIRSN